MKWRHRFGIPVYHWHLRAELVEVIWQNSAHKKRRDPRMKLDECAHGDIIDDEEEPSSTWCRISQRRSGKAKKPRKEFMEGISEL